MALLVVNFRPFTLLAELTHRCPLHCPYCSNPLQLAAKANELSTGDWRRVIEEAAALGVLHVGFSGGEPLQREDLSELVSAAKNAGLYSNLITSAVGLTPRRIEELKNAGLDSVQISLQSNDETVADKIAGAKVHTKKIETARAVRAAGFPLTINIVLHRANIDCMPELIAMAEDLGADRLELANSQYYGWAFRNRSSLLPTRSQIDAAQQIARDAKQRLSGRMELLFVTPDYYSRRPKPCMNGWGRTHLTVNPRGDVLPCPTAGEIKNLSFDNVRSRSLHWIWNESSAFNRFRGTEWMPSPCRDCDFREIDFGGCRCQAALITGEAANTDPACEFSTHRERLTSFVEATAQTADQTFNREIVFRQNQ